MRKPKWENPSFFKVMIGNFQSALRIPPAFKKYFKGKVNKRPVIRISGGREWKVKFRIVEGDLFFQDGWESFITENTITMGDFLVFFYNGNSCFDVKIYGTSGCEKEGAINYPVKRMKVEEVSSAQEPTGLPLVRREKPSSPPKRKPAILGKSRVKKSKLCHKVLRAAKEVENEKALKAACAVKITHPHFVTTCRSSRAGYMTIPAGLVKKYNLANKSLITLQDPEGTSWPVKLTGWRDGRLCLTSGWALLYQKNRLKEGDVCVFEFVEEGAAIIVHIFRAQEYNKKSGERQLTEDEERVLRAAKSFESRLPQFVALLRPSRLYHVPIPKKVAIQVGIKRNQSTNLIDPSGKQWPVQIICRSYGQIELGIGWTKFSRGNNLATGDACVFEFVDGADAIKAHIFRQSETKKSAVGDTPEVLMIAAGDS